MINLNSIFILQPILYEHSISTSCIDKKKRQNDFHTVMKKRKEKKKRISCDGNWALFLQNPIKECFTFHSSCLDCFLWGYPEGVTIVLSSIYMMEFVRSFIQSKMGVKESACILKYLPAICVLSIITTLSYFYYNAFSPVLSLMAAEFGFSETERDFYLGRPI